MQQLFLATVNGSSVDVVPKWSLQGFCQVDGLVVPCISAVVSARHVLAAEATSHMRAMQIVFARISFKHCMVHLRLQPVREDCF